MRIEFVTTDADVRAQTAIARLVFEGEMPAEAAEAIAASRFTGAEGQILNIVAPRGLDAARMVLVGAGTAEASNAIAIENAAASAYAAVKTCGLETLRI